MADNDQLTMVRDDLDGIPAYTLPEPFKFRWYAAGDEQGWIALQAPFYEPGAIDLKVFRHYFGEDPVLLAQRMCFMTGSDGEAVGTAAAWVWDGFRSPEYGRVHWVAVAGAYQGQGLSKPLLTHVLSRMRGLGHTRAYLTTSRSRPVAVALYRGFGFVEL